MYVGRFLVVGPDAAGYRVSSRSFPHRAVVDRDGVFTVGPTEQAPGTDNPYVSYNCLRFVHDEEPTAPPDEAAIAILGNGSHVDPIAEKLASGYPSRDAIAHALLTLDYERDDYDTPRIAGALDAEGGVVGIVRRSGLVVERVEEPTLIATYEVTEPTPVEFSPGDGMAAAEAMFDWDVEHPVCAVGVVANGIDDGFDVGIVNG